MATSLEKRLSNVQAAIERIETTGQSATIGDLQYTEADLSKLYAREEKLEMRISRLSGRRRTLTGVNMGGM